MRLSTLVVILLCAVPAFGKTVAATSCNAADVQTALTNAADGDTVTIPAGSCTWTTGISMTLNKTVTLQGAGAIAATDKGAATTGTDQTVIRDQNAASGHSVLAFTVANGKTLRITGLAIRHEGATTQNGVIKVAGGSNSIRIDHCHFVVKPDSSMTIQVNANGPALTGVIDHNYFDSQVGNGPFGVYLQHGVGYGDQPWAEADGWGTDKFLFVEDNRFRNGYLGDANTGGQRFIYRYNTAVIEANDSVPTVGYIANHGITSGRSRSTRAVEYYGNTVSALAPGLNKSPFPFNGGTGLIWGNTVSQYRYVTSLDYTRKSNGTYPYGTPPTGWGNCTGTSGTVWDGPGGYPCLDGPGRGKGDLLTGYPIGSTTNTRTGTQASPQQALSPFYVWGNTFNPAGYSPAPVVNTAASFIQANREYYSSENAQCGGASCTTGVGSGTRSARPASCTAGVGYWATDETTLYVCAAGNAWTSYYKPYTYPHPLQAGGTPIPPQPTTPPTAGTSVRVQP